LPVSVFSDIRVPTTKSVAPIPRQRELWTHYIIYLKLQYDLIPSLVASNCIAAVAFSCGETLFARILMLHHCNSRARSAISATAEPKGLAMSQKALEQYAHA